MTKLLKHCLQIVRQLDEVLYLLPKDEIMNRQIYLLLINININCHMIFQDSQALQHELYNDLDSLIKIIKNEQEGYLEVNDILATIFHNKDQIETNLFVDNDIVNYKKIVKNMQEKQESYSHQKKSIIEKYQKVQSIQESVTVLLKRVVYRVLEVVFNSINQLSLKPVNSYQEYIRFKLVCQKLLSEFNTQKPLKILKCIDDFTTSKLNKSLMALSLVITNLENGKIEEIDKLKLSSALNKIQQKDIAIVKQNRSTFLQNTNKLKYKVKQNVPLPKEQSKVKDKDRFFVQKKARKIMDTIKDVVQINRQEYLQDFTDFCQQENKQKLFKNMLARNKFNQKQISQFLMKKTQFKRKVSSQLTQTHTYQQIKPESKNQISKGDDFSQTTCPTTRRSLLLKFKDTQYRERTITSQFYRKISKAEEYRLKLRNSQINSNVQFKKTEKEKVGIYKTIEEIISQNQQLNIKTKGENKQRLPLLNKRALSVDQNYKPDQIQLCQSISKGLSNSIKNDSLKKKNKGQKTQMLPSKVKIELKTVSNLICNQISKKLSKFDHFNRHLCF